MREPTGREVFRDWWRTSATPFQKVATVLVVLPAMFVIALVEELILRVWRRARGR